MKSEVCPGMVLRKGQEILAPHVLLTDEDGKMCARRIEYRLHRYHGSADHIGTHPPAKLSPIAKAELREILVSEVGLESVAALSDEDLDHFGNFLLTVFAEALKLKAAVL
jgi:hypothetical protein